MPPAVKPPATQYDSQIAAQTASTGSAQAFIDTAMPAMMLVAWPVVEAWATYLTGAKSVPV